MRRMFEPDPRATRLRLERGANPNSHLCRGRKRQDMRMQNLCTACRKRVRFVKTQIVQELRLRVLVRIRGVDSVDVGPDYELVGVNDVRNDRSGKVGAVAPERRDAAVGSRADES